MAEVKLYTFLPHFLTGIYGSMPRPCSSSLPPHSSPAVKEPFPVTELQADRMVFKVCDVTNSGWPNPFFFYFTEFVYSVMALTAYFT